MLHCGSGGREPKDNQCLLPHRHFSAGVRSFEKVDTAPRERSHERVAWEAVSLRISSAGGCGVLEQKLGRLRPARTSEGRRAGGKLGWPGVCVEVGLAPT